MPCTCASSKPVATSPAAAGVRPMPCCGPGGAHRPERAAAPPCAPPAGPADTPGRAGRWRTLGARPRGADQPDPPWFMSVDVHRVEIAALLGQRERALRWIDEALDHGWRRDEPWCRAQLLIWRRRLGVPDRGAASQRTRALLPAGCRRSRRCRHQRGRTLASHQQALVWLGGDAARSCNKPWPC